MLFTQLIYFAYNGRWLSQGIAAKSIIEGYETVIGTDSNTWQPMRIIKYYLGFALTFTCWLGHMFGVAATYPGIVRLVVSFEMTYLVPTVALLYLLFAYQTE